MDKEIKIKGRGITHLLKQLTPVKGGESKTYKLVLGEKLETLWVSTDEPTGHIILNLPGGPSITIGSKIDEYEIKEIHHSPELQGFIIIFK